MRCVGYAVLFGNRGHFLQNLKCGGQGPRVYTKLGHARRMAAKVGVGHGSRIVPVYLDADFDAMREPLPEIE